MERVLVFFAAAIGIVVGVFAYTVYQKVRWQGAAAVEELKRIETETVQDFRLLLAANVILVIGFAAYLYGAWFHQLQVLHVGIASVLAFFLGVATALFRWDRRWSSWNG